MNAIKTLEKLNREYTKVVAELKEESKHSKFLLVPSKSYGETEEHYWRVTYFHYEQHNQTQQAKVYRLNSIANDLYSQIIRIKQTNRIKRMYSTVRV